MTPIRPRLVPLIVVLLLAVARVVSAQSDYMHTIARIGHVSLVNRHPHCNPLTLAFDPVWVNGWGWSMPRIGWQLMYPALNLGIVYALIRLHANRKAAAIGGPVPLEIAPHIRQAIAGLNAGGVYEANLPDWIADAWNRSLPSWALLSDRKNTKRNIAIWAVGDVALSCFARP